MSNVAELLSPITDMKNSLQQWLFVLKVILVTQDINIIHLERWLDELIQIRKLTLHMHRTHTSLHPCCHRYRRYRGPLHTDRARCRRRRRPHYGAARIDVALATEFTLEEDLDRNGEIFCHDFVFHKDDKDVPYSIRCIQAVYLRTFQGDVPPKEISWDEYKSSVNHISHWSEHKTI